MTVVRDLAKIEAEFQSFAAKKRQAWAESNYDGAMVCDVHIDRLLLEAAAHPSFRTRVKEPAA